MAIRYGVSPAAHTTACVYRDTGSPLPRTGSKLDQRDDPWFITVICVTPWLFCALIVVKVLYDFVRWVMA